MNPSQILIQDKLRRLEQQALSAASRMRSCRTIQEVVREKFLHVPPELRYISRSIPSVKMLGHRGRMEIQRIIDRHLNELRALAAQDPLDVEVIKDKQKKYERDELRHCGPDYPDMFHYCEREARTIIAMATRSCFHVEESDIPQADADCLRPINAIQLHP